MGQAAANIVPKANGDALGQYFGSALFIIFPFSPYFLFQYKF
jgi:hypothetical protein